ncbi:conserved hypothetical protein [uncultured Dysgonomonas sp.]|uniref:AntA/AntB antirepressor domain-containing protein n=1 Tax=uncultured Dysgonomonas sp. TaxID=206096 RepID=A0A212J5W1_9BACT|nr:antA/AntB antirepressor family protein [uncultured Dysgonomonas sp.]SBV94823.1 conserved hypothetical protein [uncultured Dysgonomonas sp.]
MEELIRIRENEKGEKVVSARELHAYLESKQDFSNWIKNRISKYGFNENEDYVRFDKIIETTGGRLIEYALTLNCAKELAMVEGNAKGKEARGYFIACEKKLKEIIEKQLFQANERHRLRYKKSIRLKEVDREINELLRERKYLIKEINHIDRTSLIFFDLFEDTEDNLYFGGFPNKKIS